MSLYTCNGSIQMGNFTRIHKKYKVIGSVINLSLSGGDPLSTKSAFVTYSYSPTSFSISPSPPLLSPCRPRPRVRVCFTSSRRFEATLPLPLCQGFMNSPLLQFILSVPTMKFTSFLVVLGRALGGANVVRLDEPLLLRIFEPAMLPACPYLCSHVANFLSSDRPHLPPSLSVLAPFRPLSLSLSLFPPFTKCAFTISPSLSLNPPSSLPPSLSSLHPRRQGSYPCPKYLPPPPPHCRNASPNMQGCTGGVGSAKTNWSFLDVHNCIEIVLIPFYPSHSPLHRSLLFHFL